MQTTIDPARTVAEILLEAPARAAIFEKHRIDYCCNGKRPLAEACARRGLDPAAIAEELAHPAAVAPGACEAAAAASCAELVRHIIDVHHALLQRELPRLTVLAEKVAKVHGPHEPRCIEIARVFAAMRAELEDHMGKEEEILFPFVVKLEQGADSPFPTIGRPIACMEDEHTAVGEALEQLRALTDGYDAPAHACNSWRVLYFGLGELERDLHRHIHEENNVLFPRALALEATVRGGPSSRYTG